MSNSFERRFDLGRCVRLACRAAGIASFVLSLGIVTLAATSHEVAAQDAANMSPHVFQVTGLFGPSRERDLKEVFAQVNDVTLKSIDLANAEVTLEFDAAKVFPGAKPEQVVERLDNSVRHASRHSFGIKSRRVIPLDRLQRLEIPAAGLDCRACELAAYEMVYKLPGVEMATASFRDGKIVVYVQAEMTDRSKIEAVLRERGVTIAERTP